MVIDIVRRAVLIDIAYETGGSGIAHFVHLLVAVRIHDWVTAVAELQNSLLYTQVPVREARNAQILLTGVFPEGIENVDDLIKLNEGLVVTARPDAKGAWVIGRGHDIPACDIDVNNPPSCTPAQADAWYLQDRDSAIARAKDALGSEYWGD